MILPYPPQRQMLPSMNCTNPESNAARVMPAVGVAHLPLSRRQLLVGAAATAAVSGLRGASNVESKSSPFVLVHGAWHGGWCWRRVVDRLTAKGRYVVAPTLSGVGE